MAVFPDKNLWRCFFFWGGGSLRYKQIQPSNCKMISYDILHQWNLSKDSWAPGNYWIPGLPLATYVVCPRPIWLRNPDVVNQSEYTEFYKTTFKVRWLCVADWIDEMIASSILNDIGSVDFRIFQMQTWMNSINHRHEFTWLMIEVWQPQLVGLLSQGLRWAHDCDTLQGGRRGTGRGPQRGKLVYNKVN